MIFGTTPFAAAGFSALPVPANNAYAGVTGIPLTMDLGRIQVTTPGNINVDVNVTGNQLTMATGSLTRWVQIGDIADNTWTEINT